MATPSRNRVYIRERRKAAGLSMKELAEKIGRTLSYVSELERGKKRYNQDVLEAVADALGLDVARLLEPPEEPTDAEVIDIWDLIPTREKPRALRVLRGFVEDDDDDHATG